jgi:hypothetical protein
MSDRHASQLEEPSRRVVWVFGPEDEQEVATLLAAGWRLVSQQTLGARQRVELIERRQPPVETQPKPPTEGKHARR